MCQGTCQNTCASPKCARPEQNADIAAMRALLDYPSDRNPGLLMAAHVPALRALLLELEGLRQSSRGAAAPGSEVVVRRMKQPADEGPITGTAIAERMMAICGCQGRYDCDCVSVKNKARVDLWTEYNTTDAGARR